MSASDNTDDKPSDHRFLVTAVVAAEAEGFIAATLQDVRGGRVTLQMDETCAKLLRDLLDEQLP